MGLNSMGSGSNNVTFFGLYGGDIVIEYGDKKELEKKLERLGLDPEDIETRKRTKGNNEGKKVYYYIFNDVEGLLTNVYLKETDFGEFLNIELTDADEKYVISLGDVFSRHSKDFIRRMDSIDLKENIAVGTWSMEGDNGKNYSGVRLYQNGEKIDYVLQTEDLPAPVERKKGKKKEWDYSEQEEFLYERIESFIDENFKGNGKDEDGEDGKDKGKGKGKKNKKGKKLSGKKDKDKKNGAKKEKPPKGKKNKGGQDGDGDDLPWD